MKWRTKGTHWHIDEWLQADQDAAQAEMALMADIARAGILSGVKVA